MEPRNNHISYVEFKAKDLIKIKDFYTKTFNWSFTDYGDTYTSFSNSGLLGGFELTKGRIMKSVLIVLYHEDLESIKAQIINSKGKISKDIFAFPGGRRFHFLDPSGNELAVWSDR